MKNFINIVIIVAIFNACGMGKRRATNERKSQDKAWHFCNDKEVKNPIGKLCNRVCLSRKPNDTCKKWKTNIKDISKKEDFLFFRNNGAYVVDEDLFL